MTPLLEQVIGTLATLTLRNPQASIEFEKVGGIDDILNIMRDSSSGKVQRQCCILIRNICMKNEKIQVLILLLKPNRSLNLSCAGIHAI